jgi:hypothetical protein
MPSTLEFRRQKSPSPRPMGSLEIEMLEIRDVQLVRKLLLGVG